MTGKDRVVTHRSWRFVLLIALSLTLTAGFAGGSGQAQEAATPVPAAVVREVLGGGSPEAAPGEALQLVRFTIAPGTKLPVHTHPGMQVAWLEAGALQYTVVDGAVQITRAGANASGTPVPAEQLTSGQTTTFQPWDSWVEPEGMVHFAENAGSEPVIILVASLLAADEPASSVVETATPTT